MTIIRGMGRVGNKPGTPQSGGTTYATTFSVTLSASNGTVGTTQTATISPVGGSWPINQAIALSTSGVACSISPDSRTGSGTTPVTFSFTPSAAGSVSVNAVAAGMTSTGAQSYTATAVVVLPPAGTANRFDVMFSVSAAASGAPVSISIAPNGNWPSTSGKSITLTSSLDGAVLTVALPTSGYATLSSSYTPTMPGEVSLTATNNAGLYNPYPAPLTVFATSSGTAQTITASLANTAQDLRPHQRDTFSGAPLGFSGFSRGWGEVWFTLGQSGTALFMRLYDAMSGGATATVGTGTALSGIVQVHGAFSAGTVRVLLPASNSIYYADVATDAAFTNPVRIAQRFSVGTVVGLLSRSSECGFSDSYSDGTAFTPIYSKFVSVSSADERYGVDPSNGYPWILNTSTSAGEEFARILDAGQGVTVGMTGIAGHAGNLEFNDFFGHDGSLNSAFTYTVGQATGGKFRYVMVNMSGWDGTDPSYPTETLAHYQTMFPACVDKLALAYPSLAVIRWSQSAYGWFGADGSRDLGFTRLTGMFRTMEVTNPMVVAGESTLMNEFVNGHATQGARPDYARTAARMVMAVDPVAPVSPTNRGPTLASTGTFLGRTISIPYTLNGGTALTSVKAAYANPNVTYTTASPAEIATLFSVYAGTSGRAGAGQAINIDSATVNSGTGKVDLVLTGSSGITYADGTTGVLPSAFTVHYGADFTASNRTLTLGNRVSASLCDNVTEYSIPYGRLMRPALDIAVS